MYARSTLAAAFLVLATAVPAEAAIRLGRFHHVHRSVHRGVHRGVAHHVAPGVRVTAVTAASITVQEHRQARQVQHTATLPLAPNVAVRVAGRAGPANLSAVKPGENIQLTVRPATATTRATVTAINVLTPR